MKIFLGTVFCLLLGPFSKSQDLLDQRDGRSYKTVELGKTLWMADDLKLITPGSKTIDSAKGGEGLDPFTRYYPLYELDSICPEEWRLPHAGDWMKYLKGNFKARGVELVFSSGSENFSTPEYPEIDVFSDPNPINIKPAGIYEGEIMINKGDYVNYWIQDLPKKKEELEHMEIHQKGVKKVATGKGHIHLGNPWIQIHSHHHHLEPNKPGEMRRFMVKCVKDL